MRLLLLLTEFALSVLLGAASDSVYDGSALSDSNTVPAPSGLAQRPGASDEVRGAGGGVQPGAAVSGNPCFRGPSAQFDLNTAPGFPFSFLLGSAEWVAEGGVHDTGFIKLTDGNNQSCAVIFPDFAPGLIVGAFDLQCMVKLGDWTGRAPGHGVSVNFASADDPIIAILDGDTNPGRGGRSDGWAGSFDNGGDQDNLPEEGTKTGVAIGLDTWGTGDAPVGGSDGPNDVRGISVRVYGRQVAQIPMPAVVFPTGSDGTADYDYEHDCATLITGPRTTADPSNPDFRSGKKLKWVPLRVSMDESGVLNVYWKGCQIVKDLQTAYGPSPGRVLFGASAGDGGEVAGIDDVKIALAGSWIGVGGPAGVLPQMNGFTMGLLDTGSSTVDPDPVKSELLVVLDGLVVPMTDLTVSKTGFITTVTYTLPFGQHFESASVHSVLVEFKDTNGCKTSVRRAFTVPTYTTIPPTLAVEGAAPFLVLTPSPGPGSIRRDAASWEIRDANTAVVPSSVKLEIDGKEVTTQATITDTADGANVKYLASAGPHTWRLTWKDNGTPASTQSTAGSFAANPYPSPGTFLIEAEDFNYDGGKTNPKKQRLGEDVGVMPYLGGAYRDLDAVPGVDYNNDDGNFLPSFRTPLARHVGHNVDMSDNLAGRWGKDRGTWEVTTNHRIISVDDGDWCNYTRNFPAGDYEVWAALSFFGASVHQLRGSLQLVTSEPTQPNQTTRDVGVFDAPGSGAWGQNELVRMTEANGDVAALHLEGQRTVRFNMSSGDFDYLLFVPIFNRCRQGPVPPLTLEGDEVVLQWPCRGDALQRSQDLVHWEDVPGATSGYRERIKPGRSSFYRVVPP